MKNILNVAILHYAGPPGLGGVEVTMYHHARLFAAAGHYVRMLVGSGAPTLPGVEVLVDPLFGSRGVTIEAVNHQLAAGSAGPDFAALRDQTHRALSAVLDGVDVLIVHNVLTLHKNLALTAALYDLTSQGVGGRLLAWCHDFAWHDPLYLPELHAGTPWDLLRRPWPTARYVVVSHDRRAILADLLGLPADQVAVVTPGVDLPGFYKLEADTLALVQRHDLLSADPLLLLPARITRRKNIEHAIAIVGALSRLGMQPRLVVTGPPGPHNPTNAAYLAQLQELAAQIGATDAILFLYAAYSDEQGRPRPVSDAMLADFFRLADALLFPSRAEGFGIPIIEAGLARLPIFCSDIAPFRETAGTAAHYFDHQGDPATIAARIAAALQNDPPYAFRRRTRLHYTWEAIVQQQILPLIG